MRTIPLILALVPLAACQQEEKEAEQAPILDNAVAAAEAIPARGPANASFAPEEGPGFADGFDWTGRFAASSALCTGGVWDFGEQRIVTDGETSCDVDRVGRAAGQVTLSLACIAEGMESREQWVLTRQDEGMRVSRNTGRETFNVDLIPCA